MACLRQVSFGLLDMAYYTQKDKFEADIIPFEKKAWEKAIIGEQIDGTCMIYSILSYYVWRICSRIL